MQEQPSALHVRAEPDSPGATVEESGHELVRGLQPGRLRLAAVRQVAQVLRGRQVRCIDVLHGRSRF